MTAQTHIPVADAVDPRFEWQAAWQIREAVTPVERLEWPRQLFFTAIVVLSFFVSLSLTQQNLHWGFKLGLAGHYTLWPMIVLGTGLALHRYGFQQVTSGYARFMPFVIFGVIASFFSYNPIGCIRMVLQWVIFVTAAAAVGTELGSDRLARICFWTLAAIMIGSLVAWVVAPDFATQIDPRTGRDLRGLVPIKNGFGAVCIYSMAFGATIAGIKLSQRVFILFLTLVCAYFAHSAGSSVEMVAVLCYTIGIRLIRTLPFTGSLQAIIFTIIVALSVLFIVFGAEAILGALGRDTTLTGRSDVWPAYFKRALEYWPTGAGPGTFTVISAVTVDVARGLPSGGGGYLETPHNMFIAVFGEVGLFGLTSFVAALLIPALVGPFVDKRPSAFVASTTAFAMLVAGLSETREVFGTGLGAFLVVSTGAAYLRDRLDQRKVEEKEMAPMSSLTRY